MSQIRSSRSNCGFTLVELLVVIAILMLLMALLLPALEQARERGRRAACISNLRQWAISYTAYANDAKGEYPEPVQPSNWPWGGFLYGPGDQNPDVPRGPAILFARGYMPLSNPDIFYCPSSRFWSRDKHWKYPTWKGTFSAYAFWANYLSNAWSAPASTQQFYFAQSPRSAPDAMLAEDVCTIIPNNPMPSVWYNHRVRLAEAGGHILANDGSVAWKNMSAMKYYYSHAPPPGTDPRDIYW